MNNYRESVLRAGRRLAILGWFLTVLSFVLASLIQTWWTTLNAGFALGICTALTINWWRTIKRCGADEEIGVYTWTCPDCGGRNFMPMPLPTEGGTISCMLCEFEAVRGRIE